MPEDQLEQCMQSIAELETSPRLAAHPDVAEIKETLDKGKALLGPLIAKQTEIIEAWEAEALDVARAVDVLSFRRSEGVGGSAR